MADQKEAVLNSDAMLAREYSAIHGQEPNKTIPSSLQEIQRAHYDKQSSALCLSGGGIRSAGYCLGVVQGLARRGILKRFQFLSTVSGGGYIGSLISAWSYRAEGGIKEVEEALNYREPPKDEKAVHDPVRWLRKYTSYLSPQYGFRSPDTWTLIAIYVRNLLLNWLVLLPALAALTCVPLAIGMMMLDSMWQHPSAVVVTHWSGITLIGLGILLLRLRLTFFPKMNQILGFTAHRFIVTILVVGAAALTNSIFVQTIRDLYEQQTVFGYETWTTFLRTNDRSTALHVVYMELVVSIFVFLVCLRLSPKRKQTLTTKAGLAVGLALCCTLAFLAIGIWLSLFPGDVVPRFNQLQIGRPMFVLAPPTLLALLFLPEALFVAIASRFGDDSDREWWARAVAFLFAIAIAWIGIGAIVFFGDTALDAAWTAISPHLTPGSLFAALLAAAAFVARRGFVRSFTSQDADVPQGKTLLNRLGHLAINAIGALLIVILFATIVKALWWLTEMLWVSASVYIGSRVWLEQTGMVTLHMFGLAFLLAFTALLFGYFVNVNRFSLHGMYRDRLSRAFLAASRWERKPPADLQIKPESLETKQFQQRMEDRFTQFDKFDSPLLQWLDPQRRPGIVLTGIDKTAGDEDKQPAPVKETVNAPLHVINCALNFVGNTTNTELQERKAASFTLTPLNAGSHRLHYRDTSQYGGADGISLATAMTISGAAVSPNAGNRSTPILTFIMTLFNARLGWWLGNPSDAKTSELDAPSISTTFLLRELFGMTRDVGNWLFLSDGGHFDNLGLYEMVRRGCRYILVVDASADPDRNFEDLGNAIRKIRIDFGIEIRRRDNFKIGGRDFGANGRYAAIFDIAYPHLKTGESPGTLIYVKSSIYRATLKGAPLDVVEYGSRSDSFPHEPTSDQFYLESQFESYRALGEHEIEEIMQGFAWSLPEMVLSARAHIQQPFEWPT